MKKKIIVEKSEIDMAINDTSNFLSPYSLEGKPVISNEVANFLENCANEFHPKTLLSLNIHCEKLSDNDMQMFNKAIKNYYTLQYHDLLRDIKRKKIFGISCIIIGVIALSIMIILSNLNIGAVLTECINIFAWVFIWEAVDTLFVQRANTLLKFRRIENFIAMDITYTFEDENKAE